MKKQVFQPSFLLFLSIQVAGCFSDPATGASSSESASEASTEGDGDGDGESGDSTSETSDTATTGDGDGDGDGDGEPLSDLPTEPDLEGEPCDPLDPDDPCVDDYTCSLYEWNGIGNFYEFICLEYIGEENGGGFGDPVGGGGWGECASGFAPRNNINLAAFPDGMCLGAGNGGTCCTAICSSEFPNCPPQMSCNLFLEPMNPELYTADQYGSCVLL